MADILQEFLVAIGFEANPSDAKKVQDAVAKTEAAITAAVEAGTKARVETEKDATDRRSELVKQFTRTATAQEERLASDKERIQKKDNERHEALESQKQKKAKENRDKSLKDVQAWVLRFGAVAAGIVTAVEGTALGIVAAVDKAAKSYDSLNYAAQRIGASPGNINAFTYAASQLGSTVAEAGSALEAFGQKLRINQSGYASAMERLGVSTRDAKGNLRDATAIATDFFSVLRKGAGTPQGYAHAIVVARQYGFDENVARAGMKSDFDLREEEYRRTQKDVGNDPDKAAQSGTAFEQSMRRLQMTFKGISDNITTGLFDKLTPQLDKLQVWADKHGAQVAEVIGRLADDIIKLATAILNSLAKVDWDGILGNLESAAKSFDTFTTSISGKDGATAALVAFGAALALKVLSPISGLLRLLGLLNPAILLTVGTVGALWSGDHSKGILFGGRPDGQQNPEDVLPGLGGGGGGAHLSDRHAHNQKDERSWWQRTKDWITGKGHGNRGVKNWWTPERQSHAVDRLMAEAGLTEDGAKALVSRWKNVESAGGPTSVNPRSGARGIAQWLDRHPKGDTGSFDDQIGAAVGELNGSEWKAKKILNTPGMEAEGASAYERAEGYAKGRNAGTHRDNFTDRTAAGMKDIVHGLPKQASPQNDATPPAAPSGAVGDKAYFEATQRRQAMMQHKTMSDAERIQWSRDQLLIDQYHQQQNAPPVTQHSLPRHPSTPTPLPTHHDGEREGADRSYKNALPAQGRKISYTKDSPWVWKTFDDKGAVGDSMNNDLLDGENLEDKGLNYDRSDIEGKKLDVDFANMFAQAFIKNRSGPDAIFDKDGKKIKNRSLGEMLHNRLEKSGKRGVSKVQDRLAEDRKKSEPLLDNLFRTLDRNSFHPESDRESRARFGDIGARQSTPVKVDIIESSAARLGDRIRGGIMAKSSAFGRRIDEANRADSLHDGRTKDDVARAPFGALRTRPLGDSPGMHMSIANNNTRGNMTLTHSPTYNINGSDPFVAMHAARQDSSRGQQDLLRNIQGLEQ